MLLKIDRIFDMVVRYPISTLLVSTLFLAIFLIQAPNIKRINNVDYFTVDDSDNAFFKDLKKVFTNNEFFVISFEKEELFTPENLGNLSKITADLEKMDQVQEVRSLSNIEFTEGTQDSFSVRRFIRTIPEDKAQLEQLRREALGEALYVPHLISKDGKTANIIVFIKEKNDDDTYRRVLLQSVDKILEQYRQSGTKFYIAGWTATNNALAEILDQDLMVFVPLSYLFIAVSVYLLFKSVRLTGLAILNMSAALGGVLGIFGLTGITFNNLTATVLPLAITLSLADTIHIFSYLDLALLRKHNGDKRAAIADLLKSTVRPCLLTSVTTALGFLSLWMSNISAMHDFAFIAASAMIFEFLFSFFLLPPLLLFFSGQTIFSVYDSEGSHKMASNLRKWCEYIKRNTKKVIAASLAVAVISFIYLLKVPVETDVIEYFRPSHQLRQNLDFVEPRAGGVTNFDVVLMGEKQDSLKDPLKLAYLDKLQTHIKSIPKVTSTSSYGDFMKEMNKSFHNEDHKYYLVPTTLEQIEQFLLLYDGKELRDFVNPNFDIARVMVRMTAHSTREQREVLDRVRDWIETNPPPQGLNVRLTGHAVNYVNVALEMVDGQISSFGAAAVIIGLLMLIVFKSVTFGLLSLIPNIYPIILTFGVMGIFQIPLDTGTIMVASVALGIACDDTVHFLFAYQKYLHTGMDRYGAVQRVLVTKGRAIISSAFILSIGFGVLIFGNFVPVVHFGLLCAITMVCAIIGDLLLLPAILLLRK